MRFDEALTYLESGYKIYRKSWNKGFHIQKDENNIIFKYTSETEKEAWLVKHSDLFATDWKAYSRKDIIKF